MIFDVVDNKVIVIPEAMELKEIKSLWDSDKTKGKIYFERYIKYIFYVYREEGIYRNQFITTRKRLTCVQQLNIKETEWESIEKNKYVKALIKWYQENSLSKEERLLVALDEDIDHYLKYLMGIKYTTRVREEVMNDEKMEVIFRDIDNSTEKMKAIKNSKDLIIYRAELKKLVRQTGKGKSTKKSFRTRKFEE